MSFYRVPRFVFDPVGKTGICDDATILLPADFTGGLEEQINNYKPKDIIKNNSKDNIQNSEW